MTSSSSDQVREGGRWPIPWPPRESGYCSWCGAIWRAQRNATGWLSSAADSAACPPPAYSPASDIDITLIDQRNHHLFQPLLYQVATGILSPGSISPVLRHMLRKRKNVEVVLPR